MKYTARTRGITSLTAVNIEIARIRGSLRSFSFYVFHWRQVVTDQLTAFKHALFWMPEMADCELQLIVYMSKQAMKQAPEKPTATRHIQPSRLTFTMRPRVERTEHCEVQTIAAHSILLAKAY